MLSGLLAGLLLGAGYLNARAFALALNESSLAAMGLTLVVMLGGLVLGFVTLLGGYYRGRVLVVKSTSFVASQVVTSLGGILCMSERFPEAPMSFGARIAGYSCILVGLLIFSGFHGVRAPREKGC